MRGAWIEKNWKVGCRHVVAPHARSENWKPICNNYSERNECRSPYGERELKIQGLMMLKEQIMSLPIRGARIEKETNHAKQNWIGRSPCGERELKYQLTKEKSQWTLSLPIRGARIEIIAVSSGNTAQIAPHAGSENWNIDWYILIDSLKNRSPCRERELKSSNQRELHYLPDIAPQAGSENWNLWLPMM